MRVSYALNVNHDFFFKICELWFQIIRSLCVHMNYMHFMAVWDQWRHLIATQIKDKPEKLLKTCLYFWWKLKTNAKPHKIHKAKGTAKPQNRRLLAKKPKNQYQIAKKSQCPPPYWRMICTSHLPSSMAAQHNPSTQLWKWLHGVLGQKNFQMGLPSIWACYEISLIFIENILIFSHPPSFELSIIL